MDVFSLLVQLDSLAQQLQGAAALNIYLLHKQGGQIAIDRDELIRINAEFSNLAYSMDNDILVVKLSTTQTKQVA